jgi:hypothetical protein
MAIPIIFLFRQGRFDGPPRWALLALLFGGFFAVRHWMRSLPTRNHAAAHMPRPSLVFAHSFSEQLSMSTLVSALASGLLTSAAWLGLGQFDDSWLRLLPQDLLHIGLVGFGGSTALVAMSQGLARRGRVLTNPSWMSAVVGAGVGLAAAGLDQFLMVRGFSRVDTHTVFDAIGPWALWQNGHATPAAYVMFFAVTFALQDWAKALAPQRAERWRFGVVAWAGLIGFLASLFFGVPKPFAVLWAVMISLTAQLAAPWQPMSSGGSDSAGDDSGPFAPVGGGNPGEGGAYATVGSR